MNDDLVVQKISKLLENNTAFIGYALNGGIGTKINVRNTETGKTIQALSINVDSVGEVLVVKDSTDNQYKAVTFKVAEKVSEKIIQIRKTKPTDDKKIIDYTDVDIEVFYLFVKLIDTGSPVATQLQSTWIRKGNSCTQFVGAYERCNYASKKTIAGVSYTGLPYQTYTSLTECLNDDLGPDAKTPHGTSNENGANAGWKYFSTKVSGVNEQRILEALTSHDAFYGTSYKNIFGYGSILECSGAMNLAGWEYVRDPDPNATHMVARCEFSYLPGFTRDCTATMEAAGYCDQRGFISSKAPLFGQEAPGQPSVGNVQNDWGHTYGWVNLPYTFMYKRHFGQMYLLGATAPGGFYILEVNDDQVPGSLPPGYFPWVPGCPGNNQGGPYDGSGGNRFPDEVAPIQKRDMKLSNHKAEIWLGSSKKTEAIKLYELGASDLFSGMYNAFILAANESEVDRYKRANINIPITVEQQLLHDTYYTNWNKNIIDLRINPRVWIYVMDNVPKANYIYPAIDSYTRDPSNDSLQLMVDSLYNRAINLTIVDKDTLVVHLKLGLTPKSILSNTDCKGFFNGFGVATPSNDILSSQSWEYQKYVTIKIKKGIIESITNTLDTTLLPNTTWNKEYINKKFFTNFGSTLYSLTGGSNSIVKDLPSNNLLRSDSITSFDNLVSGNNYEQYNYSQAKTATSQNNYNYSMGYFPVSSIQIKKPLNFNEQQRRVLVSTSNWWALWDRSILDNTKKRFSSIVGYDKNAYQILTSYRLNQNLNYLGESFNNRQVNSFSFFEYVPTRPKIYVPSAIKSVRNKLVPIQNLSSDFYLASRERTLNKYGTNFFQTNWDTRWHFYNSFGRLDGIEAPYSNFGDTSGYYGYNSTAGGGFYTRERRLFDYGSSGNYRGRGLETSDWFNNLWAQFIYDGVIKVDVDSYKEVEFKLPINPSKYIKYTTASTYANAEYPFVIYNTQDLDTVLSPGKLDVTKQVPIKKPTNVELDPNMSFLVYLYPNVVVTKKKKEI